MKSTEHVTIHTSGGPREGHDGVRLGSSWPEKGILKHLNIILPTKTEKGGVPSLFEGFVRAPGPPRGGDIGEGLDLSRIVAKKSNTPLGQRPGEWLHR